MKRSKKKLWKVSLLLMLSGVLFMCLGLTAVGFDVSRLEHTEYVEKTCQVTEAFSSIAVDAGATDLYLFHTGGGACEVRYMESDTVTCSVEVQDGVLRIRETDMDQKWYRLNVFSFGNRRQITVSLPEVAYQALSVSVSTGDVIIPAALSFGTAEVQTSTGDVMFQAAVEEELRLTNSTGNLRVEGSELKRLWLETHTGDTFLRDVTVAENLHLSASTGGISLLDVRCGTLALESTTGSQRLEQVLADGAARIKASTGGISLLDVRCGTLALESTTGNQRLEQVLADGKLQLKTTTGNVTFQSTDAGEMEVVSDTGNITGTLRSEKRFQAHSDVGKVSVPESGDGGACVLRTGTGKISISLEN